MAASSLLSLSRSTWSQNRSICSGRSEYTSWVHLMDMLLSGSGEPASLNSMKAVSSLLGGIPIDFYLALNIDGIAALNDALGGVTVTLAEDLSALDPAMVPGATLQLTGTQAELYLRGRRGAGSGTNRERMARQQIYLSQLADLLDAKLQADANFAGELYDVLEPYLSTNLSRGRLINEIWAARDYERADLIEPEGSYKIAPDGFVEFFADQEQMHKYAAELFCMPFP